MATHRKTRGWVTSVLNDDSVEAALVLANSIRKTKTNYLITAIVSTKISQQNCASLRLAFDTLFLLETSDNIFRGADTSKLDNVVAKVHALSLLIFEKCVYVSPNFMFLENSDSLFDQMKCKLEARIKPDDGSLDLSLFSFEPDKALYLHFLESLCSNGNELSDKYLGTFLKNQKGAFKIGKLSKGRIAEFCLRQRKLLIKKTHAPIIQFVNGKEACNLNAEKMKQFQTKNMGLPEERIANLWSDMLRESMGATHQNIHLALNEFKNEPIAIVGMSCRYPGANSLKEFWNLLFAGKEGICEPPNFRWTKEHCPFVTQQDRKSQAGFLSVPVDEFDARFFGVSPKEAAYMDPQTRLLHEIVWESLEDAGIDPLSLYGTHTGIFTGSWMNDYKDIVRTSAEKDFFRTYMGNSIGAAAARLSFLLGLTGPSIATESGCSSAIVALDLAVRSLRAGETNLALAGGVNLLLHSFNSKIMEFVISPGGRCKTFDAKADGFARAEGCGVLVLKRMSDAARDGDHIWALVRGSAISQEGLSRSLGTPTVHCEALAMKLALENANVAPEQVSFVETHGTGTSVGDPMEVAAIAKAYYTPNRKEPLVIGSVKTNVGHTESCSGITGVMKSVLALKHELIPKHLNLETLNPEIFLDSIPAVIPLEPIAWPKVKGQPRICGVSSFGITGTDGHVIIQEAPDYEFPKFTMGLERPTHIVKISGKSEEALEDLLKMYETQFQQLSQNDSTADFANMAYSANVGRASFNHRTFLVANDFQSAAKALQEKKYLLGNVTDEKGSEICFLFTGQGSQYAGMAKQLYETSPIFQASFDACERTLKETYNVSIKNLLWESDPNSMELSRTIYSQTSIFCVEYCLLKLWQSWGIKPNYVLGHSLGEFCAAVAAEILSFEDALKLVAERSRLIDNLPRGSMLVIKASKKEVDHYLVSSNLDLDYAAENSPEQTVVAGDTKTIQSFLEYLKDHKVKVIILEATHAFHSHHMDPMLENYRKIAASIKYKPGNPNIQYISGMEGKIIENSSEIDSNYWVRHTRERVNFTKACATLKETGCTDFLEIGPQPVLNTFVMLNNEGLSMNCLPSLRKGTKDWETILTSLGKLYLLGYQINWKNLDECYPRRKVSLPFHPFHRKSFWVDCSSQHTTAIHPLVGHALRNASALNIFQNELTLKSVPYLKEHCIGTRIVFPGAGFTEMCLSAGYCMANSLWETLDQPSRAITLENMRIEAPLELFDSKICTLQVIVDLPETEPTSKSGFRVKVFHQNAYDNLEAGKWVLHASALFTPATNTKACLQKWNPSRVAQLVSTKQPITPEKFYKQVDQHGLKFGESFKTIQRFWTEQQQNCDILTDEVVAEISLPVDSNKYLLHPLIIDAVFQTGILTGYHHQFGKLKLRVPVRIGKVTRFPGLELELETFTGSLFVHCWWHSGKYNFFVCTSTTLQPLAYIEDLELIETNVATIESVLEQQNNSLPDAWEETWKVVSNNFNTSMQLPVKLAPIIDKLQITATSAEDVALYQQTNRFIYLLILRTFYSLGWTPRVGDTITDIETFSKSLGILTQFQKLIRFYLSILQEEASGKTSGIWTIAKLPPSRSLVEEEILSVSYALKNSNVSMVTKIYERIAEYLPQVLKGEEPALALLFPEQAELQQYSADSYYQNFPGRAETLKVTNSILKPISQASRCLNQQQVYRFLEVGAGTGSLTTDVLEGAREIHGNAFEYYYTDISPSFFLKAEKRFEAYAKNVKYAVFNIEESPLSQGIPLEHFDMVVCTDVLHATRNLKETLAHLRQTLKPGGILFFTETIIPARDITFVFGLLEGYWRYEDLDCRPHHCCVNSQVWRELLSNCGFHSATCIPTYANELGIFTAVADESFDVARGPKELSNLEQDKEWILFADVESIGVMAKLCGMLNASGFRVTVLVRAGDAQASERLADLMLLKTGVGIGFISVKTEDHNGIHEIVGREAVKGVLFAWGLMDSCQSDQNRIAMPFLHLAKTLVGMERPPQLLVVTQGILPVLEDSLVKNPTAATLLGMTKSLKNENAGTLVRFVDLEQDCGEDTALQHLLYEMAMCKGSKEQQRVQVAYRGNVRYEPRLVQASVQSLRDFMKLPSSAERYHLKLPDTRLIQDLEFEPLEESTGLEENEFEIEVKAFALNFRDVFTVLKPSKEFESLNAIGLDVAGVVSKVGSQCKRKVGERVFGINFKQALLPSHLVVDDGTVLTIPTGMTYCEAVTLPAVFLTAYQCLIVIAKMKKEDTVLIHTGSGGVGLAAIQLAKHVGAKIITTAGNPRKRAYLRSLGIEHVFHSRDTSYEQDILRVTNGKGVDIVLNSITGPGIKEATLRATARNGRWIEMSKLSVWSPEEVKALRPDVFYKIEDLTVLDKSVYSTLLERMQQLLADGTVGPIPFVKFDALGLRQAMQHLQKAKHIGKVVVAMPEIAAIQGQFKVTVPLFDAESTYLITGGLGGIGLEVCKWMVEHGATDIVLTGRNPAREKAEQEIEAMNRTGFNIRVLLGDVGDYQQCQAIIETIRQQMKPLRGIMHCAGVLRDNSYANQSWADFEATFAPKVNGTWNLHNLSRNLSLEHFVVYSSVTALLGTLGQPNHAAANTFEDAFIHYRHSLGLPGTSINWGQWAQVGCAKDISLSGVLPVSVQRMLNGLEIALRNQKRQVCFSEFDNFQSLALLSPLLRGYVDERLWNECGGNGNGSGGDNNVSAENFWREMDGEPTKSGKETVMANYLKTILRSALRLDSGEPVSDTADLQEIGVDSLMMIELKNSIQSLLGSRLSLTTGLLKNCNSVRLLAEAVVGKLVDGVELEGDEQATEPLPAAELIKLLETDSVLPDDIRILKAENIPVISSQVKTILLTGATGHLGQHILAKLISNYDTITKIVCVLKGNQNNVAERLKKVVEWMNVDLGKVECLAGNVAKARLGLSNEIYEKLCDEVDAVIHCAAKMHNGEHLRVCSNSGKLTDCRSVNLGGTLNLLRFACNGKTKRMYYPSNLATGILIGGSASTLPDMWPEAGEMESIVSNKIPGLQTCKYICERLMEQANSRGIPCKVFRFPWIAGDSTTGRVAVEGMYIKRFLSYLKLGAMPMVAIPANFLPVDICAELSLRLFFNDNAPCEIYNLSHPQPELEQEFVQLAKEEFDKEVEILTESEFESRLQLLQESGQVLEDPKLITRYLADASQIVMGYLSAPDTFFTNEKVARFVDGYGESFGSTMETLRRDLRYLRNIGLLSTLEICDK